MHTGHDDIGDRHIHHGGKVVDGHVLGEFEHLRLGSFLGLSLGCCSSSGVTLVLAVLDSLLVGLVGQTSEGVLHLPLYILFGDLLLVGIVTLLLVLALMTTTTVGVLLILAVATLLALGIAGLALLDYLVYIDLLGTTLTTAAMALFTGSGASLAIAAALSLLLALLFALLLGLLLGTGGLVEGVEIDGAEHVDLRLFRLVESEHLTVACLGWQRFVVDAILAALAPDGLVGLLLGGSIGLLLALSLGLATLAVLLGFGLLLGGFGRLLGFGLCLLDGLRNLRFGRFLRFGLCLLGGLLYFGFGRLLYFRLVGFLGLGLGFGSLGWRFGLGFGFRSFGLLGAIEVDVTYDLDAGILEFLFGLGLCHGGGGSALLLGGLLTRLRNALIDGIDLTSLFLHFIAVEHALLTFALRCLLDRFVPIEFLAQQFI